MRFPVAAKLALHSDTPNHCCAGRTARHYTRVVDAAAVKRIVTLPGISGRLPVSATAGSNSRPVWCRRKGDAQRRRERHEAEELRYGVAGGPAAGGLIVALAGPAQRRVESDPPPPG